MKKSVCNLSKSDYPDGFIVVSSGLVTKSDVIKVLSQYHIHLIIKQYPALYSYTKIVNYMNENLNLTVSY